MSALADHSRRLQQQFQDALKGTTGHSLEEAVWLNPVDGDAPRARFLALRHHKAAELRARLLEAGIVTDVRDDVIRFGFGPYQDEADVERLIETLKA